MLEVSVSGTSMDLGLGTDESYELSIPASGGATLSAPTVYGALRGMETFSQLVGFDPMSQQYTVGHVPWNIQDMPRFSHRGILLDTSRHFHSIRTIKRFVDSLSYAKFNVFHWHIVDSQSFPLQLHTLPNLVKGAYTPAEIYTPEDVMSIVEYAKARGVRVIPEFDTPGHAASWCVGYPDICPSTSCTQPLNPATNATFDLIKTLITESKTLWTDDYFHLGGDEVNTNCWTQTPSVAAWLKAKNFSTDDAYKYFVQITHSLARSLGRKSYPLGGGLQPFWLRLRQRHDFPSLVESRHCKQGGRRRLPVHSQQRQRVVPGLLEDDLGDYVHQRSRHGNHRP